jgi:glyoxylase-like metal-dependent hydrolase (beta-lactamase superfamily II)
MKRLALLLLFVPLYCQAWVLPGLGDYRFEAVTDGVYIMHGPLQEPNKQNQGFMNNPGIVVSDQGVILVDPGGTYQVGKQVLAEIKKITAKPVLAVFNSHIHGDHWLANQAVKEAYPQALIYAHPKMIAQAKSGVGKDWINIMQRLTEGASKGTQVVAPDKAVQQGDEIVVAGQRFKIHTFDPAHTDTDVLVEHVNSKTLFMGDNSFNQRMARFDSSSNMHGAIKVLNYVQTLDIKTFIPGHGKSGDFNSAAKPFLNYLTGLQRIVKEGLEQDLEDYEIKAVAAKQLQAYKDWHGFDEQFGKHVFKMYLEIQAMEL